MWDSLDMYRYLTCELQRAPLAAAVSGLQMCSPHWTLSHPHGMHVSWQKKVHQYFGRRHAAGYEVRPSQDAGKPLVV